MQEKLLRALNVTIVKNPCLNEIIPILDAIFVFSPGESKYI
jgi:hypothetical protein